MQVATRLHLSLKCSSFHYIKAIQNNAVSFITSCQEFNSYHFPKFFLFISPLLQLDYSGIIFHYCPELQIHLHFLDPFFTLPKCSIFCKSLSALASMLCRKSSQCRNTDFYYTYTFPRLFKHYTNSVSISTITVPLIGIESYHASRAALAKKSVRHFVAIA